MRLNGFCSLFNVVSMKGMIQTGDILDAVGNNHRVLVFEHTIAIMEVKPWMEVTF